MSSRQISSLTDRTFVGKQKQTFTCDIFPGLLAHRAPGTRPFQCVLFLSMTEVTTLDIRLQNILILVICIPGGSPSTLPVDCLEPTKLRLCAVWVFQLCVQQSNKSSQLIAVGNLLWDRNVDSTVQNYKRSSYWYTVGILDKICASNYMAQ